MKVNSNTNQRNILSINLIKFANSILDEINYCRVYPSKYYQKIYEWSQYLKSEGNNGQLILEIPNKPQFRVKDVNNYTEALKFVKGRVPSTPLSMLDCLVSTTGDYLEVIRMNDDGQVKNGNKLLQSKEDFVKRIAKFGVAQGVIGESIDLGEVDVELFVLKLILDEDFKPGEVKPNQALIFNHKVRFIGISSGILPTTQKMITVIDYCENLFFKNEKLFKITKQKGYSPNNSVVSESKYMETYQSEGKYNPTLTEVSKKIEAQNKVKENEYENTPDNFFYSQKNSTNTLVFSKSYSTSEKGMSFNSLRSNSNGNLNSLKFNPNNTAKVIIGNGYMTHLPTNDQPILPPTPKSFLSGSIRSEKYAPTAKRGMISLTLDLSKNTGKRQNYSQSTNQSFYSTNENKKIAFPSDTRENRTYKPQQLINPYPPKSDPLLQDPNIENVNISKKYFRDRNNVERVLITKTISYKDGSINETTYKAD